MDKTQIGYKSLPYQWNWYQIQLTEHMFPKWAKQWTALTRASDEQFFMFRNHADVKALEFKGYNIGDP